MSLEEIEKVDILSLCLKKFLNSQNCWRFASRAYSTRRGENSSRGLTEVMDKLHGARRIIIAACGTSWHSGLVAEYLFEELAQIPVEVEYASEFRYKNPLIYSDDIVIVISQSGETADTLAALREAKSNGATVLGVVNVVGSTIARETHAGVYLHTGPEIGVASPKRLLGKLRL